MGQDRPRHDQLQTVAISQQAGNCSNSNPFHESVAHVVACDACRTAAVSARGRYAADHYFYPEYKLGNVQTDNLGQMVEKLVASGFGQYKEKTLPAY
jgi:sulfatase maturation enzyme AslB (radical SAM superfamily)